MSNSELAGWLEIHAGVLPAIVRGDPVVWKEVKRMSGGVPLLLAPLRKLPGETGQTGGKHTIDDIRQLVFEGSEWNVLRVSSQRYLGDLLERRNKDEVIYAMTACILELSFPPTSHNYDPRFFYVDSNYEGRSIADHFSMAALDLLEYRNGKGFLSFPEWVSVPDRFAGNPIMAEFLVKRLSTRGSACRELA